MSVLCRWKDRYYLASRWPGLKGCRLDAGDRPDEGHRGFVRGENWGWYESPPAGKRIGEQRHGRWHVLNSVFWYGMFDTLSEIVFYPDCYLGGCRVHVSRWAWDTPHQVLIVSTSEHDAPAARRRDQLLTQGMTAADASTAVEDDWKQWAELVRDLRSRGWWYNDGVQSLEGPVMIDELRLVEGPPPSNESW